MRDDIALVLFIISFFLIGNVVGWIACAVSHKQARIERMERMNDGSVRAYCNGHSVTLGNGERVYP